MDQKESNAKVKILDADGATIFNGRRTVRNVENDGEVKAGFVTIRGRKYRVIHRNWEWTGTTY